MQDILKKLSLRWWVSFRSFAAPINVGVFLSRCVCPLKAFWSWHIFLCSQKMKQGFDSHRFEAAVLNLSFFPTQANLKFTSVSSKTLWWGKVQPAKNGKDFLPSFWEGQLVLFSCLCLLFFSQAPSLLPVFFHTGREFGRVQMPQAAIFLPAELLGLWMDV